MFNIVRFNTVYTFLRVRRRRSCITTFKNAEINVLKLNFNFIYLFITSGFWPRVRARALRAPVFLSALPR
jgi:hypothetical protein